MARAVGEDEDGGTDHRIQHPAPMEFLCLIVPKPMLLRRLTNHATRHSKAQAPDVSGARRKSASERAMVTLLRLRQ